MKRTKIFIILAILAILIAAVFFANRIASPLVESRLKQFCRTRLNKNLEIGAIKVFPKLELTDLTVYTSSPQEPYLTVASLQVNPVYSSLLFKGKLIINSVYARDVDFHLIRDSEGIFNLPDFGSSGESKGKGAIIRKISLEDLNLEISDRVKGINEQFSPISFTATIKPSLQIAFTLKAALAADGGTLTSQGTYSLVNKSLDARGVINNVPLKRLAAYLDRVASINQGKLLNAEWNLKGADSYQLNGTAAMTGLSLEKNGITAKGDLSLSADVSFTQGKKPAYDLQGKLRSVVIENIPHIETLRDLEAQVHLNQKRNFCFLSISSTQRQSITAAGCN